MSEDLSLDLFPEEGGVPDPPTAAGPAPAEPRVWTVSEVNRAVRNLLEESIRPFWVSGEVANWTRARSGHRYFSLKDEAAQLRCVMWRRDAVGLPIEPEEGLRVRAFGYLTLYEARGEYQLSVRRLEGEGREGLWRLAFEELRKKLDAEGLMAVDRKRALPRYPSCIGLVTSPTGAAIRDILTGLRRRAPWIRVVVRGARVQGEGAAREIARGLKALVASGLPDVIVVARGGGSVEDLWAFNEEVVARAIAACPVPVVSAVGHEIDVTISDLVADARAATPSAAAEAVSADGRALLEQLADVPGRLARALAGAVGARRRSVTEGGRRLARALERALGPVRQTVDLGLERLERGLRTVTERRRQRIASVAGRLEALSPLATLRRGYAVALSSSGDVLRRTRDLPQGRRFTLRVRDGSVACDSRGPLSESDS